jgi:phosphate transport system substrate-binding protein
MNRRWKVGEWAGLTARILSIVLASSAACADDASVVRIGGTGMALAAMQQAGTALSAVEPTIRVTVLPSLGTPGGLKALAEDAIDVAVTGRPLKADEKARGATAAGCVTTPLIFVTSHPSPNAVAKTDIPGFYRDVQATWHDGRPLKVILRSRAGSENDYLKSAIAGMDAALDAAYARPDIPVATTDQENADGASRIAGSFAIMTMLQLYGEKLNLRPVALDGVMPSAAALADKTYPLSATVCVVLPPIPKPAAASFVAYLKSDAGQALLTSLGATPLR